MENQVDMKKKNSELSWLVADRWFRVVEFSLILGLLSYFAKTTNSIGVKIIFYVSWGILFSWFEDLSKLIFESINSKNKFTKLKKAIVWGLSFIIIMSIYFLVAYVADLIISQQNK